MAQHYKQKFTVEMDKDLPVLPFHGVLGGVNHAGEIEMNFFTECDALPEPRNLMVTENGEIMSEETERYENEPRHIVRTINCRTVLTQEQAKMLCSWLMKEITALEGTLAPER